MVFYFISKQILCLLYNKIPVCPKLSVILKKLNLYTKVDISTHIYIWEIVNFWTFFCLQNVHFDLSKIKDFETHNK